MPPRDEDDEEIQGFLEEDDDLETDEGEGDTVSDDEEDTGSDESAARQGQDDRQDSEEERPKRSAGVSRASKAVRELRLRAQRAEADKQATEARLRQLEQQVQQPREDPNLEEQRLALMTSDERLDYKLDRAQRQHQMELRRLEARNEDQRDEQKFRQLASSNYLVAGVADEVEAELAKIRAGGGNVDRERLADYLIGRNTRKKAVKALKDQKKTGERNIRRQTVQTSSSRSDVSSNRRELNEREARMKRLEGVTF